MSIQLSPRQSDTVATAITVLAGAVILGVVLGIFFLFARFMGVFSSVFLPLFVALILALVLRPFYDFFAEKLHLPAGVSVFLVFAAILIPFTVFLWFFGALAVSQLIELSERLPELSTRARNWINSHAPQLKELWDQYGLSGRLTTLATEEADSIWGGAQSLLRSAFSAGASAFRGVAGALSWFVLPVYLVFFLMAPPVARTSVDTVFPFLKEETRKDVAYLLHEFINIMVSFFRGQLIVALGQGILFALGFVLIGLQHGFVIGLLLGFLNIIPYLGSMIGLAIVLPLAFFQQGGGLTTLGLAILVFTIVQMIEGYLLTPKVMGDRTGLHPLTIIVALFFWGTAFDGLTGMILAIPLTAFLVVFWRLARTKYIKEIV